MYYGKSLYAALATDWREEKAIQRQMIAERLKAGMAKSEVVRILKEWEKIAKDYERV